VVNSWPRAISMVLGLAMLAVFYPVRGVDGCPSEDGCTSRTHTFWNLALPGGEVAILPAVALGLIAAGPRLRLSSPFRSTQDSLGPARQAVGPCPPGR
jgi:hypothetical protein